MPPFARTLARFSTRLGMTLEEALEMLERLHDLATLFD